MGSITDGEHEALAAIPNATQSFYGVQTTGGSETFAKATQAECEILRKQGKDAEAEKLQDGLQKPQADAAAVLRE